MSKKIRKMRPEPPKYYYWDTDNCWFCKNRNGCSGCKILKQYIVEDKRRNKRKRNRDEKRFFDFS